MADKIKHSIFPLQALTMESLESKGLFIDDLQKLRVMDPELEQQTSGLKEECGAFVTQMGDFQKMTDGFIALSDEVKLSCGIMQKKSVTCIEQGADMVPSVMQITVYLSYAIQIPNLTKVFMPHFRFIPSLII